MGRILALDVGTKRVGIALGDEETKLASPFDAFPKAQGRAESQIAALVATEQITKIIVGLPLSEDGSLNDQCLLVIRFCRRLKRRLNVPLLCVDEYLTSLESQEILGISGRKERQIRGSGAVDAMSAALILKSFFDSGLGFAVPDIEQDSDIDTSAD